MTEADDIITHHDGVGSGIFHDVVEASVIEALVANVEECHPSVVVWVTKDLKSSNLALEGKPHFDVVQSVTHFRFPTRLHVGNCNNPYDVTISK